MTIKGKAAICDEVGTPLRISEVEFDEPRDDEVLIEIRASGLCHSDLHVMTGALARHLPGILGHEAAGVVARVGTDVRSVEVGDHVVPVVLPECRNCEPCTSGRTNRCASYGRRDSKPRVWAKGYPVWRASLGAFATHVLVPEHSVAKVRPDAPLESIFYLGCGVATGVGAPLIDARVEFGSRVAVIGVGGVGLNAIQGARMAGAAVIVAVDPNGAREAIARDFGATHFLTGEGQDIVTGIMALTSGGADYCFECVGRPETLVQAFASVRPEWGECYVVGGVAEGTRISVDPNELLFGKRLRGSLLGGLKMRSDIPKFADWYMDGVLKIDELVTHRLTLEEINDGFELMKAGQSIRSVILF